MPPQPMRSKDMDDVYENPQSPAKWGHFESMFEDRHVHDEGMTTLAELLPRDKSRLILDLGCPIPILEPDLENSFGGCSFVAAMHFHFTTVTALKQCWDKILSHFSADAILCWQWSTSRQHGSIVIAMAEHLEAELCLEDVIVTVEHFFGWSREIGRCLCPESCCKDSPPPLWAAAERACVELTFWKDAEQWWSRRKQNLLVADGISLLGDWHKLARVYGCNTWPEL